MNRNRAIISPEKLQKTIDDNTYWSDHRAKDMVKNVAEYKSDKQKELRLKEKECKSCFYFTRGRLGGAAMTTANCEVCGKETTYGSTNTDRNCGEHGLCVRCTGKMEE